MKNLLLSLLCILFSVSLFSQNLFTKIPTVKVLDLTKYEVLAINNSVLDQIKEQSKDDLAMVIPFDNYYLDLILTKDDIELPMIKTSSGKSVLVDDLQAYSGIVANDPLSAANIYFLDGEVMGIVTRGEERIVLQKQDANYIVFEDKNVFKNEPFTCGTNTDGITVQNLITEFAVSDVCTKVYLEVDNDIFKQKGSVANTAKYITSLFDQVKQLYANDGLKIAISEMFIWDTPSPYVTGGSGEMLTQFYNYRTDYNGDVAQLLSYKSSGGIAFVDVLCNTNKKVKTSFCSIQSTYLNVPTYSWSVMVMAHELGHNFGSPHTHDCAWNGNNTAIDNCVQTNCASNGIPSAGGTIMSYCHLNSVGINFRLGFGEQPSNLMRSRVASANCLTVCDNGGGGDNPPQDTSGLNELRFTLKLDTYSPEISWQLVGTDKKVFYEGKNYNKTQANLYVLDTFFLPPSLSVLA